MHAEVSVDLAGCGMIDGVYSSAHSMCRQHIEESSAVWVRDDMAEE